LPRYPIKTVILIGLALLMVQGVSELLKLLRSEGNSVEGGEASADAAPPPASIGGGPLPHDEDRTPGDPA
jgi:hypothetical protein